MKIRKLSGTILVGLLMAGGAAAVYAALTPAAPTPVAAAAPVVAPVAAVTPPPPPVSPEEKAKIESVLHDYIIKNPEVIVEALQAMQQKQMDEAKKTIEKTHQLAPKFADQLFHNAGNPVIGNPKGAVSLVEFFDYQCPHCVNMQPIIEALIKANPDLRVVYVEFPIRGKASETATRIALAAQIQGKYYPYYGAMMKLKQLPITEAMIFASAKTAGLDIDKAKLDMNNKQISDQIAQNTKLGQDLQLLGTPALFIAKTDVKNGAPADSISFIPGQADQEQLQQIINKYKH